MTTEQGSAPAVDHNGRLRLDNQLCFALYAATRAMTKAYRERLEPMGLTYPQYLVLLVLWEEDGLTVSEIGALLMLDSGTLTPVLKRMESSGLVARRRSSTDEREVVITLTKDAENLRAAGLDAQCAVHCRLGMSEDEIRALRADIMALVTNIEQPAG